MENLNPTDTALLVHIEHSKPIEVTDFITSVNAVNSLFNCYKQKHEGLSEMKEAKLYVEKIEHNCIDIFFCEVFSSSLIPFVENTNVMLEFAGYIKGIVDYFTKREGEKPDLSVGELKAIGDLTTITAGDFNGSTTIGAVCKSEKGNVFNNCSFHFHEGNGMKNQTVVEMERMKEKGEDEMIHKRVLMTIYQVRNDSDTNKGNKAIIDDIFKGKKVPVVFETDELKNKILYSEINPTTKAFQIDAKVQTVNEKPIAYKVMALHDIIDIE